MDKARNIAVNIDDEYLVIQGVKLTVFFLGSLSLVFVAGFCFARLMGLS
jgi:hypothetical protein